MSALSVLYLILPFPIAFVVHEAEVMVSLRRSKSAVDKVASGIASLEKLLAVILVTMYLLSGLPYAQELWYAMFFAFAISLFLCLARGIMARGYVPGLVSAVILIPYICMGIGSISLALPVWKMLLLALAGFALAVANNGLAQKLGQAVSESFRQD